ncbi:cell division control protein 1 [Rhexocercosporidium sp. MPI-PUGE-AT-0058]|nr:cell division control protein 1 [Rhexocercosporidium sp. MPI-PUGE-AT-0058]
MAPSYYNSNSHSSTRDHCLEPPSLISRILLSLPPSLAAQMQRLWSYASGSGERQTYATVSTASSHSRIPRHWQRWHPRQLLSLPHLFVLAWVLALLWGERWVFQSSVESCGWGSWERWPKEATPHHLILIADPQLIDPHSYPGRPWPLDKFTMMHTDNYMKRSYISLQKMLHPDTVFFLGDLFDGGREWKTAHGNTNDPSWANGQRPSYEQGFVETWGKRYGEDFWLHEYDRFGKIFYDFWNLAGSKAGSWQRGRKIITTLPGNHDLGFGDNIKIPIRNRFETYFGEGNRVDVIGNHTFVSIDSVSLSAGGSEHDTKEITKPVEEFLDKVQSLKRKAVARELSIIGGEEKVLQYPHKVEDISKVDFKNRPTLDPGPDAPELPTILLTHVPLYREPGTPCGPKREHWPPETPPKGQLTPVIPDHRNAISISRGYQYQNVLSESDSIKLIKSIGNVGHVFSGDDHDYCEIIHSDAKNNAREITVKSTSWAMGVRKPGFLMLSMWNPVDAYGIPLHSTPSGHGHTTAGTVTMESHLCLLPDQLGIFIRYGLLIGLTILALTIRAILTPILHLTPFSSSSTCSPGDSDIPLLPTNKQDLKRSPSSTDTSALAQHRTSISNSSTSSTHSNPTAGLAPRSSAARTRSVSPAKGYGLPASQVRFATPPLINGAGSYPSLEKSFGGSGSGRYDEDFGKRKNDMQTGQQRTPLGVMWREMWTSVWRVTWVAVLVYLYLARYG